MLDDAAREDRADRARGGAGAVGPTGAASAADDAGAERDAPAPPSAPTPPPRPPMSLETAPPLKPSLPPPLAMRTARGLWLAALTAGTAAVLFAVSLAGGRLGVLDRVVQELAADVAPDRITAVSRLVYWSSLAGFGLGLAIQALLVLLVLRGRAAARWWALAVAILPQSAAAIGMAAFVAIDRDGTIVWLLVVVHWVLGLAAVVCSLLPGSREWLAAQREAGARPRR